MLYREKEYNYEIGMNLKDFEFCHKHGSQKPNNMSRWVEGKDLGISIQKPGEDKVWDNRVIKGMKGVGDQRQAAKGKAVLNFDIVLVKLAVLTEMCRDKMMDLSNHFIPIFSGRKGKDPKKNKIGATIQLLGKDENTGWDGGCTRS